ncbi:hypothetical protein R5H32_06355 [Defluviimonas sp. D31]|nr:hypothetical protein [Defluviimonas sp. D31]
MSTVNSWMPPRAMQASPASISVERRSSLVMRTYLGAVGFCFIEVP